MVTAETLEFERELANTQWKWMRDISCSMQKTQSQNYANPQTNRMQPPIELATWEW
jgi:hypothetical protein